MGRRAQGTDITLHKGPAGEFGRGLVYQRLEKALEMGNFLHRGPVKNHVGVRSPGTLIDIGAWKQSISLYGHSVKGT